MMSLERYCAALNVIERVTTVCVVHSLVCERVNLEGLVETDDYIYTSGMNCNASFVL